MNWLFSNKNKKNIRVKATPGKVNETFVTVSLTNSFDFLQVLSLKLTQSEVYRLFDSTYGMVAGRVIGNESLGIPNCRVSIFIPKEIDETETKSPLEAVHKLLVEQHYPYESVTDEDGDGRRYNLLTNQSKNRGFNGFPENELNIGYSPKTPVGTFPEKEELLANDFFLTVYEKYYKYSTVTNASGDYMLFGVPTGTHTLHMDCDLTDIGRWSLTPAIMSRVLGYPIELFIENGTKIQPTTDLDRLPNIQTQNISVTVRPFWSQQTDKKEIGVTRQDFKISVPIVPSFTVFGSNFTMARNRWWGDNVFFRLHYGWKNLCFRLGYDCSDKESCDFVITVYVGIIIDWLSINWAFKINCDQSPKDNGIFFGLSVQLPNKIPFIAFEFGDNPCRLEGGKYDSNAFDIINHGNTCQCKTENALQEVPDSGITDALLLNNHRTDNANIKVFSLKKSITDNEADILNLLINANKTNTPITTDPLLNRVNETTDIELLAEGRYAALIEPGQFALQIPTNRRPMITDEEGNLVDSPDPSVGVFTEFRGYMYITTDGDFDSPEGKYTPGRVAMKIPQSFDYSATSADTGDTTVSRQLTRFKEWIFNHTIFKAGEIYSVAQKIAIKNSDFDSLEEEGNHTFNGGGTDANLGDPFDPNYETNGSKDSDIGWDTQTGILLFTDDTDLTLVPSLGWKRDGGTISGVSLNYVGYPKVIDYIPPTHQTTIGKENEYTGRKNYGRETSENAANVESNGDLSTTGYIDNTIAPIVSSMTFSNLGYYNMPKFSGALAAVSGSLPFPYYCDNRGPIAQTWTSIGDVTRSLVAVPNLIPRGTNTESVIRFHPNYTGLPGELIENTDGAVNWYFFTGNGQRNLEVRYYVQVDVLFMDTMNQYMISDRYAIYGKAQGVFIWEIEIPRLELEAAAASSNPRTNFRARLKFSFTENNNIFYWTPELKFT